MPPLTLAHSKEASPVAQWSKNPGALLNQMIAYIQAVTTTPKANGRYVADGGHDVTDTYTKMMANVFTFFDPRGEGRLASSTIKLNTGQPADYSALLGAYFRQQGEDGNPLVTLTKEQLDAVYDFVRPLIPASTPFTPKEFLDSFTGAPNERHKQVLKRILFHGISAAEQEKMCKGKYKEAMDSLIDSNLSLIEFLRTPIKVLAAESDVSGQVAKTKDANPKIAAIELQVGTLMKAAKEAQQKLLEPKEGNKAAVEITGPATEMTRLVTQINAEWGAANERRNAELAAAKSAQQFLKAIGVTSESLETAMSDLAPYLNSLREIVVTGSKGTLTTTAVAAMPLSGLITAYGTQLTEQITAERDKIEQWRLAHEAVSTQVVHLAAANESAQSQLRSVESQLHSVSQSDAAKAIELRRLTEENGRLREQLAVRPDVIREPDVATESALRNLTDENVRLRQQITLLSTPVESVGLLSAPPPESPALKSVREKAQEAIIELSSSIGVPKSIMNKWCAEQLKNIGTLDASELKELMHKVGQLQKIATIVSTVTEPLKQSSIWTFGYDSRGTTKAKNIQEGLASAKPDDILSLLKGDISKASQKGAEYPGLTTLFTELSAQRALIFTSKESSSFSSFKQKISDLQKSPDSDSANHQAEM